jgi:hypothetical protein
MAYNPGTYFGRAYYPSYFVNGAGVLPPGSMTAILMGSASLSAMATGLGTMASALLGQAGITATLTNGGAGGTANQYIPGMHMGPMRALPTMLRFGRR